MSVRPLTDENIDALRDAVAGRYLHGDCYSLAIAMHRRTGWPIVAALTADGKMPHVGVRRPDGVIVDVRGEVEDARFLGDWACCGAERIAEVSEDALLAVDRQLMGHRIRTAERTADALFPDLPGGTAAARLEAFLVALHALCREHGFYIRAPYPAARPVVYEAYGDEQGYEAERMMVGGWTFDRRL